MAEETANKKMDMKYVVVLVFFWSCWAHALAIFLKLP